MGESHIFREGEAKPEKGERRWGFRTLKSKGRRQRKRNHGRGGGGGRALRTPHQSALFFYVFLFSPSLFERCLERRGAEKNHHQQLQQRWNHAAETCSCWNLVLMLMLESLHSFLLFFSSRREREREGKERQLLQSGWVCSLPSFVLSVLLSKSWFFTSFSDQFFIFSFSWLNRSTIFWLNWFGLLVSNETWRTD